MVLIVNNIAYIEYFSVVLQTVNAHINALNALPPKKYRNGKRNAFGVSDFQKAQIFTIRQIFISVPNSVGL